MPKKKKSNPKPIEENASLELCNLVEGGMSLKEAREFLSEKAAAEETAQENEDVVEE